MAACQDVLFPMLGSLAGSAPEGLCRPTMAFVQPHLFTVLELEELRNMVGRRFDRILSDQVSSFRFEAGDQTWVAMTSDFEALSQNTDDEILAVRLMGQGTNAGEGGDVVVAIEAEVQEIEIVRGLVWFTDHQTYRSPGEATSSLSAPRTETDGRIHEVLRHCTGGHEEVTTHPTRRKEVDARYANLVDAGFIARLQDRELACFSWFNGFIRESDFLDADLRQMLGQHYEFIPIDDALDRARQVHEPP
jgi:hypothetical protein